MDLNAVVAALKAAGNVPAWQVVETRSRSTQRYTVFARDEARRQVDTTRWQVTVQVHSAQQGKPTLGESSFTVGPEADAGTLKAEVERAVERAALVHNARYALPAPQALPPPVETVDERVVENAPVVVDGVVDQIRNAVAQHPGVELSSSEVFADYQQQRVVNHLGLDIVRAATDVLVEYVLLANNPGSDEVEIWQSPRSRLTSQLDLVNMINRYVTYTQDGLTAGVPQSGSFDVVFGEEALDNLFDFFVGQAQASALYDGWSRFKPGEPVVPNVKGETLTLTSDPTLPGGTQSRQVDGQGQPCVPTVLIRDNVFERYVASKKFADLTGVAATGPMGNVVVAPGTRPRAALLEAPGGVYELLRFSAFGPNAISGAFSAEVRTGYLHKDGNKQPVKGGSVSGMMLDAFANAAFSAEATRRQAYQGPHAVLLRGLSISGG